MVTIRGLGTLANLVAVAAGGLLGLSLGNRMPKRLVETTMGCIGLATLLVGLQMAWGADTGPRFIATLLALVVGAWLGEAARLEDRLEGLAARLKRRFDTGARGDFARGFVTASLLFCVGPLTILGALSDGLRGDPSLLFTKAALDGFSAIALAAGLGPGVLFSAGTILVYQGGLTLAAGALRGLLTDSVVTLVTATGGLMIVGLGLNLLGIAKLRVVNMLPGLLVAAAAGLLLAGVLG